ncbi:hypothetical protein P9J82_02030 [Glaesserella parasuis]|uniref:hypothetical protein n=1 Tax=Glaesserella parasuis TaxID=738 RepID=UPI0003ABDF07|nr:hypothetical protein [Glaesserella parasuis]EQA13022.1 hypothetical protein HPS174_0828 [Glaesserella parasuis 174]MCT8552450.1 hypothetical protein [Glaesserella parasuis]MCT8755885.1 hypothetical protein [Glaesserella parasuis]MCT8823550.1 hypothetical protein [Glaesserella parasuis]MDD2170029.1 hypothetical protein [Glaesserella parasuis]
MSKVTALRKAERGVFIVSPLPPQILPNLLHPLPLAGEGKIKALKSHDLKALKA